MDPSTETYRHSVKTRMKMSLAKQGKKNPSWRGGKYKDQAGYIRIWVASNVYELEHRLVMEKKLGRKLARDERVYHKDGIKDNNDIDNLVLLKKGEDVILS